MTELERALVALDVAFPPEPELWAGMRVRIERRRVWRRPLVFAVALGFVAFGIAMAVPDARSAILRFFHVGAVSVERVETLPGAQERPLTAGLGAPVSRADAEARSAFRLRLPDGQVPTRYYFRPGLIATMLQVDGKPVLLVEFQGEQVSLTKKFAASETSVQPAEIGEFGLWLTGGRHVMRWSFGAGSHELETRLAGNVLLWLQDDRTYRLEGALSKEKMLELAHQITR
jgi:hypothetical protein